MPLTDEQITHTLNDALLKEAEEIKAERKTLKERLEKLEQTREGVNPSIYQKVAEDYISRLNKTLERLASLRKNLEGEHKELTKKKTIVEAEIKSRRETIEEIELRHALGEIGSQDLQEAVQTEKNEIKRLEQALKELAEGLGRHLEIFEGEKWVEEEKPESTARIKVATASTDRIAGKEIPELEVWENGKPAQTIPVDRTIHIGRSPANEVALKEAKVSRRHAEIQCVGGKYILMDLESSNGTFIGGKKITEQILKNGDEILIGNTKMVFKF